ncbi:MAG: DUF389 domain-containing protein [Gammaproteobacteria bacterium]
MNEETPIPEARPWIFAWFPKLDREERQELSTRIRGEATGGADFYVMMLLASGLASLGLLQGSTAVIIGAMLVAPLVGPLIGTALALVQGNTHLMRVSLQVCLTGIALGLTVSLLFGLFNPGYEPTLEVEARGRPDLFDLFIALGSGMVAAYAQGRPKVSGTLAGVAIAAALLPPLAVVGIASMTGEVQIAAYAAVLMVTNLVAIILGAALIFRLLGCKARGDDSPMQPWAKRSVAGLLLIAIMLSGPLILSGIDKDVLGPNRPYTYPVSVPVRNAVEQFVADHPSIKVVAVGRKGVEPEAGIMVVLTAQNPVPENFSRALRQVVRQARGITILEGLEDQKAIVQVFIMQEALTLRE